MPDLKLEVHQIELRRLADVAQSGEAVYVECLACEWLKGLEPAPLIARFGLDFPLHSLRVALTCERCHSGRVRLLLNDRSKRGDRAWSPAPPRTTRD